MDRAKIPRARRADRHFQVVRQVEVVDVAPQCPQADPNGGQDGDGKRDIGREAPALPRPQPRPGPPVDDLDRELRFTPSEVAPPHIGEAQPPVLEARLQPVLFGLVHGEVDQAADRRQAAKCRSRRQPLVHGVSRPRRDPYNYNNNAKTSAAWGHKCPPHSISRDLALRYTCPTGRSRQVFPLVFASTLSRRSNPTANALVDLALIVLGGGALLIAIVLWFDNAQGGLTGNGAVQEPGAEALGHRSGQRAALSLELPVLSALRRALPPARLPGRVRGRSAAADDHPQCHELRAEPRHRLPADPQPHGRPAGGRCWRRCSTSPRAS